MSFLSAQNSLVWCLFWTAMYVMPGWYVPSSIMHASRIARSSCCSTYTSSQFSLNSFHSFCPITGPIPKQRKTHIFLTTIPDKIGPRICHRGRVRFWWVWNGWIDRMTAAALSPYEPIPAQLPSYNCLNHKFLQSIRYPVIQNIKKVFTDLNSFFPFLLHFSRSVVCHAKRILNTNAGTVSGWMCVHAGYQLREYLLG